MAFFRGGLKSYPKSVLYEEISFLAYYFHWSCSEIMNLPHKERVRFCSEISEINKKTNVNAGKETKKNIFDI
ncbi:MAG: DUF6760 family protein [Acutalibacteraceae bacterium]